MNKKNLILLGGGGHCKSIVDVAESSGYKILGILDTPEQVGKTLLGHKVIGVDDDIPLFLDIAEFIITVGFIKDPNIRIKLYNKVKKFGGTLATIVAQTAYVSKYASIGEGTVVLHKAFVNAGVRIGNNVIINTLSNIEHDCEIGDHSHISTGSMINGCCKIGSKVFIGSQTVLVNGVTIGDEIVIGAGSVVCKSLIKKGIYVGSPARLIG